MIAVLGECVADGFAERREGELTLRVLPGGGPANTAAALARLGTRARFLGRLSGDVFGELFRERLAGVDLAYAVDARGPTARAGASLDGDEKAGDCFHAAGAAGWQGRAAAELAGPVLDGARCLHTGSLALVRPPGRDVVEAFAAAAAARVTVSVDPNVRPSLASREAYAVERWCAFTDVLRLSDDDLAFLRPGEPVERVCDEWHAAGARLVVVTKGADGALVSLDGARAEVPAPRVDVVDTVGAGDAFTAGLLYWLDQRGLLG